MSAADYKGEAKTLIAFARDSGSESAAMAAVANATLYLAEQQRIANLIAVANAEANIFSPLSEGSPFTPIFVAIREGLDLK